MTDDHHGWTAGRATLLLTATDGILGMHTRGQGPDSIAHRQTVLNYIMARLADVHAEAPVSAAGSFVDMVGPWVSAREDASVQGRA